MRYSYNAVLVQCSTRTSNGILRVRVPYVPRTRTSTHTSNGIKVASLLCVVYSAVLYRGLPVHTVLLCCCAVVVDVVIPLS